MKERKICNTCDGKGKGWVGIDCLDFGVKRTKLITCPDCDGSGWTLKWWYLLKCKVTLINFRLWKIRRKFLNKPNLKKGR